MTARGIRWAAALCGLAAASALADARSDKTKKTDEDVVDILPVREKLIVLASDTGHYFALEPQWEDGKTGTSFGRSPISDEHIYFGDDRTMYRQRRHTLWFDNKKGYSVRLWDPRANTDLALKDGKWSIACGKRRTELTDVTGQQAAEKLIDKATFRRPRWKRAAYALARDDRARYYYVDRLQDEFGGAGFRVFVGPKGKLREQKMVDVARDSEGDIFATKKGSLRLVMGRGESTWIKGKARTDLTYVPVDRNLELIYGELGVYASEELGVPCDHY